jgi:two-component sensor histidine kinase
MKHVFTFCFFFVRLALVLGALPLPAQPLTVAQADSLKEILREGEPDTNRVRNLLELGAYYRNKTLDPARNLDTALVLARQAQALSRQLHFGAGTEEAVLSVGKVYLRQGQPGRVLGMLDTVSGPGRIRLLLEAGKDKLRPTYARDADRAGAIALFDRAHRLAESMGSRHWQQESQLLRGAAYVMEGDWNQGKAAILPVIEARRRAGDRAGEIKAWLRLAVPGLCEDCRENIRLLAYPLALARQAGDRPLEAVIHLLRGHLQKDGGNLAAAEEEARRALAIQQAVGSLAISQAAYALSEESLYLMPANFSLLSNAKELLAEVCGLKGKLDQKLFFNLEVVRDAERSGLREELDYAYAELGNTYHELGRFDQSLQYHQQALAVSWQKGQALVGLGTPRRMTAVLIERGEARRALQLLEAMVHPNLPLIYLDKMVLAQSFAACYAALGQPGRAEQYYLQAVASGEKEAAVMWQQYAWQRISRFYVSVGQHTKAHPYVKRLLAAPPGRWQPDAMMDVHLMKYKIDSALADYPSALRHYQQYVALKDSVMGEKNGRQIAELSIRYETEKKEQQLALREKDNALLREQSRSQRDQRNGLLAGMSLLLTLLLWSYNRYRLKQRSNRQLKVQQEEINRKNVALQGMLTEKDALLNEKEQLLAEKERLLKEIHHRVKNNLQVVMSLLNSQADSLQDQAALSAIQESQHRVQAMALIHQKLYQVEGVARIPMPCYLEEIVAYLNDAYQVSGRVGFYLEADDVELDVTQAVPLGLIINEAVTNALKYAFPGGRHGRIVLALQRLAGQAYRLTIADDGVGLPTDYDPAQSHSLGMTLLHGFSAQLDGELSITSPPGVNIVLVFAEEPFTSSAAVPAAQPC